METDVLIVVLIIPLDRLDWVLQIVLLQGETEFQAFLRVVDAGPVGDPGVN